MTIIYLGIIAIVLGLSIWNLFTEDNFKEQLSITLVLIPLAIRLLLIK